MAEAFARWIAREPRIGGDHLGRRLGRHDVGDGRHARAAGRHSEGHGLDRRFRRRARLCRRDRHRHVHSVADVQGLNSITEQVLANAAHALAGMIAQMPTPGGL